MSATTPGAGTAKKLMTADEFWEFVHRPENQDRNFELIRGGVVEVSRPRRPHGSVVVRIGSLLDQYAERVGKGCVDTESGVALGEDPATVVGPDVAFYDDANAFDDLHPKWGDVPPVLAVEVASPSDRPGRTNTKIREYLTSGVKIVWLVDYEERNVTVYRPKQDMEVIPVSGELTGGTELPGLSIKVADIFKLPAERKAPPTPPPAQIDCMVRIKICGVTTPDDARFAADAGADAVGLNFYPKSPRFVQPQAAVALVRALPAFTAPVGVFVGTPLRQVCALAFQLGLRGVQTYDEEPPDEDTFPFAHIPAFRVKDTAGVEAVRRFVEAATALGRKPAAVLVDAHVEGQMGGTGHRAPWELLAGFDPGVPVILAGGLTPENVADAIAQVRPWGVDVASGVESAPGLKNPEKVRQFVKNARTAAAHFA